MGLWSGTSATSGRRRRQRLMPIATQDLTRTARNLCRWCRDPRRGGHDAGM